MNFMKKFFLFLCAFFLVLTSCSKKSKGENEKSGEKPKVGIAKIVQHVALDDVERGIVDALSDLGVDAEFDFQNANGDVGTASQIASRFKSEKVDVAVGIATPVALALANALKDVPVVFGTVTDPIGAGLVSTLDHGEKNVTGMSDAIPSDEHVKFFAKIANIKTLGYIFSSNEDNSSSALKLIQKGCDEAGIELITQSVTKSDEVKQAAQAIVNRVDGVYLSTDNTIFSAISALVSVFKDAKKPIFSGDVTAAKNGGIFMANGFNYYKAGRATGEMVAQILGGKNPSELAIRLMTNPGDSDFLIDLDAAKNCNIELSDEVLSLANLIFENDSLIEK